MRRSTTFLFALTLGASFANAALRNVPSALYPTIQSAENASVAGDTINIGAGVYTENVVVDVNNLIIQGSCYNLGFVVVDGSDSGNVFTVSSTNVTLKCMTLRNGLDGVYGDPGTGLQLQNLRILSIEAYGVRIVAGDNFKILSSEIRGTELDGIYVVSGDGGVIQSTTVRNVKGDCIALDDSDHTLVTNNTIQQCYDTYGIYAGGDYNSITLNNVSKTQYSGIYTDGDFNLVWKNTLRSCGYSDSAILIIGDDATIDDNTVTQTYYDAINSDGDRLKIRRNRLTAEDENCVEHLGDDLLLTDNVCTDSNSGYDIGGDRARLERNLTERTLFNPYDVDGKRPKVLNNRALWAGAYDGFFIDCSDDCTDGEIRNNEVANQGNEGGFSGFYLKIGAYAVPVTGNRATDGAGHGFELDCTGCTVTSNVAVGNGSVPEAGFYVLGNSNTLSFNQSQENHGPGFEVRGDANVLTQNSSVRNLEEGYLVVVGSGNLLSQNLANGNAAEGFDNNGLLTDFTFNVSNFNRRDCTNDGTIDQQVGNSCQDGSNFNEPSAVDN